MNYSLPGTKKLISLFVFFIVVGIFYFLGVRKPATKEIPKDSKSEQARISNAFFIPPESTTTEVKVRGRVLVAEKGELKGATHKVVDGSGKVLIYAFADDDKLKQQEQSVVTLVGKVPIGTKISPKALLEVDYISFK